MVSRARTDCAILRELQNAWGQSKTLTERVDIAEPTGLQRVRRLRENDVIDGYRASRRPEALGVGLQAMVSMQLETHSRFVVEAFREDVRNRPEATTLVVRFSSPCGRPRPLASPRLRSEYFTEREAVKQVETSLVFEREEMNEWPSYPAARE